MYVVDTNVVSELRKTRQGRADARVVAWVGTVSRHLLFLSAISLMELEIGVLLVERRDAKHGKALRDWMTRDVKPNFSDRILAIDETVAIRCAALLAPARKINEMLSSPPPRSFTA